MSEELVGGRGRRYRVLRAGEEASYGDVIQGWRCDEAFREWFNRVLAGVPFGAYRWETPGVNRGTLARAFEFVVLDAPGLVRRADVGAFAGKFEKGKEVVAFENLGRDAMMVVPCAAAGVGEDKYVHLGAFVRGAPAGQRDALWRAVGEAMEARLATGREVWLSTAGMGVAWLHVRLDAAPKYYGYAAYRGDVAARRER